MSASRLLCPVCGTVQGEAGCPHGAAAAKAATPPAGTPPAGAPPAAGAPAGGVPAGGAASPGIFVGADVVPRGDFKLSALGFERSGKTTFFGMLYFLLTTGRLPGYRFAWSDSLRELEQIRAQLHRPPGAGGPAFPPRTDTDKTVFLHLGLRRWEDQRWVDLYFPELSGEDVGRVCFDDAFPAHLRFLRDFDGYLLFVDATSTSALDTGRHLLLVQKLIELKGKGERLEEPVAVLLTKWDLVAEGRDGEPARSPEEFFRAKFGGLHDAWMGQLREMRVFGVSAVGRVRTLLGHDGLPIQRDGAVLHVPDPERVAGDDPADPPAFVYRPFNLSRPVLWLLDAIAARAARAGAASAPGGGRP